MTIMLLIITLLFKKVVIINQKLGEYMGKRQYYSFSLFSIFQVAQLSYLGPQSCLYTFFSVSKPSQSISLTHSTTPHFITFACSHTTSLIQAFIILTIPFCHFTCPSLVTCFKIKKTLDCFVLFYAQVSNPCQHREDNTST